MSRFSTVIAIAKDEWLFMRRSKIALMAILMLILLVFISIFTAYEYQRSVNLERAHYQAHANHEFESQPDRHPHRVAHFGHFLFRPLDPLATFDSGVDTFTGNTIFLEAHRQNSANFGDVRQSSLLMRFGQLTPAFILQILAPLLLIFIGHAVVSREREHGTLRLLLSQGIDGSNFLAGKILALSGIALLIFLPAVTALLWITFSQNLSFALVGLLTMAYMIWLLIWVLIVILVSSLFAHSRDALLVLLAIWSVSIILLPRIVPDIVSKQLPLQTTFATNIAVEKDLSQLGDSHNPNDPYFTNFKKQVLNKYGVTRIEELPVNYKGLLMEEGERMTTELFNRYTDQQTQQQFKQNAQTDLFGVISPILSLRRLSMIATASDFNNFSSFLTESERYRYALVQQLNQLETEKISYQDEMDESKENRLDKQHWHQFPEFKFQPSTSQQRIQNMLPPFIVLLVWFSLLALLIKPASNRINRRNK